MLTEILAWGMVAALYAASFGMIALPKHWYRTAQGLFMGASVLADARIIHWVTTSTHALKMRVAWCSVGLLATTSAAVWFLRKVQRDIREADSALQDGNQGDHQRALISSWRRMVVVAERKYKSGKEPGVSFAEIFQRQPDYLSLSPLLSNEAITALKDKPAVLKQPTDAIHLLLAREIARIETKLGLGLLPAAPVEPKLAGRVDCLDLDVDWDLELYGLDEAMPLKLKVTFALNVTLWNETQAATTVSGFSLLLLWQGGRNQADKLPVEGYSVQRSFPRSEPGEWGYEVRSEDLVAFPSNIEITNSNHTDGWLRFLARHIPAEAGNNAVLRKDVTWELYAHDRKGNAHKIYEGTWDLQPCGSIERNDEFVFS